MFMRKILLASQSPRRHDLLVKAGYHIETFPPKLSEILNKNLSLDDALIDIARQKWVAALAQYPELKQRTEVLLCSDTMVVDKGEALGKAKDREQAKSFLESMSGQAHEVKTSILLGIPKTGKYISGVYTTKVFFRSLKNEEIEDYLDSEEWIDKAGAYGIQGLAGNFVDKIDGSLDTVIGLPVEFLPDLLSRLEE